MMKKLFKKKEKFPTTPVPRTGEEIKAAYFELRARAGETQYHINVLSKELAQINANMESLNHEMAARQKLDAETAKTAAPSPAVAETAAVPQSEAQ
jgi:hypothetical protein